MPIPDNNAPQSLEDRLSGRGRNYFAFMKCPIDGTPVFVEGDQVFCDKGHHHYSQNGIIFLADEEQIQRYNDTADKKLEARQRDGWSVPDEETFKRLPQSPLEGWPKDYWRKRAFVTAELWRFLEELRREAEQLPIGDLGSVADLSDGMGWLGYGMDVAGYTSLVVSQDATVLGLDAFPYARYPRIQASLQDPPLISGRFDFVLYSFSLHLLDNIETALASGADLLKPNGHMIVLLTDRTHNDVNLVEAAEKGMENAGLHVSQRRVGGMGNRLKKITVALRGGPGVPPLIIGKRR